MGTQAAQHSGIFLLCFQFSALPHAPHSGSFFLFCPNWNSQGTVGMLSALGSRAGALFFSEASEKLEAAGQACGWASPSLLMPVPCSLFCPQWSQAAPMAEGEHKPHEGESLWPLEGYLSPQGRGGRPDPFLSSLWPWDGGRGVEMGIKKGRGEHRESHPSFRRTLFPTQVSVRNRTCCLFLLVFPVKFYLEREQ